MKPRSQSSLILSIGMVLAAVIIADTLYKIKCFDNSLQVVGSAKQHVTSDSVHWRLEFTRPVTLQTVKQGTALMQQDLNKVVAFFSEHGVSQNTLIISPVIMTQVYEQRQTGPTKYTLRQTVELDSTQVAATTELTKLYPTLIDQGVILQANPPEYYVSKLPEIRVSLLKGAMEDAKLRAKSIAESGGQKVGQLKSASAGVVQVLSINSTNVADYGAYDTSQIEKDVMVSVRATFTLR